MVVKKVWQCGKWRKETYYSNSKMDDESLSLGGTDSMIRSLDTVPPRNCSSAVAAPKEADETNSPIVVVIYNYLLGFWVYSVRCTSISNTDCLTVCAPTPS